MPNEPVFVGDLHEEHPDVAGPLERGYFPGELQGRGDVQAFLGVGLRQEFLPHF